ncbi:glutamate-5-semialdehyde dehydrogenase [Paraconexibacter antarcticus]|uniref:Gamma-glutamyl phosphate reductase n=1 Tax=Paraconexibacter antarcticus TaxID=2949664 RepID=A0ABY5DM09_9ACTN|nr:glutamate-5-semialdehyde dehydrogenase [Paraconexibacter antarcticus]UTI62395.1 glutamate-5-semialdehyde dehydrogenase [Paraconexibacter antarcticus]
MATTAASVTDTCLRAQAAARELAAVPSTVKDAALEAIAAALVDRTPEILDANARDMEAGREAGLTTALLDRLQLTEARIAAIAGQVRDIAALADPVGEVVGGERLPNGLDLTKVRVPLGVVAVVYEARPNVTIDAAALCLKSGNAIVLRGSSSAARSNAVLATIAGEAATAVGVPDGAISLVAGGGREELAELATQTGVVDLIIPRGGEGLKNALKGVATVPVIFAASGNCHVYVDATADLDAALAIVLNAKTQRPGVCNAAETLLVHADAAPAFLPRALAALRDAGVELRVDGRTRTLAGAAVAADLLDAADEDWDTEFLELTLAVGVVDSVAEAVAHINRHGSGHSEAIVTGDVAAARLFERAVDAACVYVNASTRFTDGGEFGMGAEIGNSTQKLHARGPIGLRELCTTKYVVRGDGHVRS